ncbi:MAG: hypothetical protein LBK76_08075, partial [Verrucomicrobiales bacterium]|nr:hypothetical protein [Verrucomicrobiales bacterium]
TYKPDLPDPLTPRLQEHVNNGGAVVAFATGRNYQLARLSFMLATTGFMCWDARAQRGEASVSAAAPEFAAARGATVPWYFEIRPWHAVERGQEKHYIYERPYPYVSYGQPGNNYEYLPPGSWYWTRPLNNRDWQTLAALDDFQQTPLLLAARYGAGRTIASGADLAALSDSEPARALWAGILQFLPNNSPSAPDGLAAKIDDGQFDRATRALTVSVNSGGPQPAELVVRQLSFEGTLIRDLRREVKLVSGRNRVAFTLPAPDALAPAETRANDRYLCRVAVLTDSGATLADERVIPVDAAPPLTLTLASDETRRVTNALFPDTGILSFPFAQRYGLHIANYAYRPGDTVNVSAVLRNGVRNLAPLAQITDVNAPDNQAVIALTDNGVAISTHTDWYARNGFPVYDFKTAAGAKLKCVFPLPVTLESIALLSGAGAFRAFDKQAPDGVRILADGRQVYENLAAHEAWVAVDQGNGVLNCAFEKPVTAREWTLEFPAVADSKTGWDKRNIAEVWCWGWAGPPPAAVSGTLTVSAVNILSGEKIALGSAPLTVAGTLRHELPFTIPESKRAEFYRVDASFLIDDGLLKIDNLKKTAADGEAKPTAEKSTWLGRLVSKKSPAAATQPNNQLSINNNQLTTSSLPLMALRPAHPLTKAYGSLDPNPNTVGFGFIVSRGFRVAIPYDTGGLHDQDKGWGNPDDLIWCFAYGFKEVKGVNPHRLAGQLFVSDDDYRHYTTPWRDFANGVDFYAVALPHILASYQKLPAWKNATIAELGHSDRWDNGPQIHCLESWQDLTAFDDYLRAHGQPPLTGTTRGELLADLHQHREAEWRRWNLDRYLATLRLMAKTFGDAGKQFRISAQGSPVIPVDQGREVEQYVVGSQTDGTWGMEAESPARTYGGQMGVLSLAPDLNFRLLTVIHWVSAVLNNPQWRGTVATVEVGRRRFLPEYFIGRIHSDGRYTSMHDTAFSENGRNSNRTSAQDYQAYLQMFSQGALLTPSAPIGAGLVTACDFFADPKNFRYSFFGNDIPEVMNVAYYNGVLSDYGYPVSFTARLDALEHWPGAAPLLVTNPASLSARELAILAKCEQRGCQIIALLGGDALPPPVAQWFAANPGARKVIPLTPRNPLPSPSAARAAVAELQKFTAPKIAFSPGLTGYGFVSNGRQFIFAGDWLEQPRVATLTVRSDARQLTAAELTNHHPLTVTNNGDGTFTIALPLTAGDGALITFEEQTK